jgi:lipoate synthase
LAMGFKYVMSGPLVRSSYRADEIFIKGIRSEQTAKRE